MKKFQRPNMNRGGLSPYYCTPDGFSFVRQPRIGEELLPSKMHEDNAMQRNENPRGPGFTPCSGSTIPSAFIVMEINCQIRITLSFSDMHGKIPKDMIPLGWDARKISMNR